MESGNEVRILFRFYSEEFENEMKEIMWGLPVDTERGFYQLDSLPFYIPFVATDDIVHAEWDEEENMLAYRETVQPSGNSIIWVVVTDEDIDIDDIRFQFFEMNCMSEAVSDHFFSMEVKASTSYLQVKNHLNKLRSQGILDYKESCLSENHQY